MVVTIPESWFPLLNLIEEARSAVGWIQYGDAGVKTQQACPRI